MPPSKDPKTIYEAGGTEIQTSAGGARRYRKRLSRIGWRDLTSLLSESFANWSRHNDTRMGASLAFYTLLSVAPFALVVASVAGLVLGRHAATNAIVQQSHAMIGSAGADIINGFLLGSRAHSAGVAAGIIGLVTLLFAASGVLIELRDTLNVVWEVPAPETSGVQYAVGYVKQRLLAFAMVIGVGFLLIVSVALTTAISSLGALSVLKFPGAEFFLHLAISVVSFLVISALFAAIYKVMPDVDLEWRDVLLGGAVTSLLFTIGKLLLGIYLGRATYSSMYGAAASLVAGMVWVYYSGQIFFLGAEMTRTFAQRYGSRKQMVKAASDTAPEHPPGIVKPSEAG
ncbi:MAG: YihY/virulence factor BrkB family protein [Bryobacteraceae bacterium]